MANIRPAYSGNLNLIFVRMLTLNKADVYDCLVTITNPNFHLGAKKTVETYEANQGAFPAVGECMTVKELLDIMVSIGVNHVVAQAPMLMGLISQHDAIRLISQVPTLQDYIRKMDGVHPEPEQNGGKTKSATKR